ncbi:MAG: efflux RND transporter periplasmic adaptor subunit [Acidobacteria bacterium]|nr:efflux RND transporter periplasmic adaptor subunit [Acidobacteriota bacterium]
MTGPTWKWGVFWSAGLASPEPAMPVPTPLEPAGPSPAPAPQRRGPRVGKLLVMLALVAVAVVVWNARRRPQPAGQGRGGEGVAHTAKVFLGTFEKSLRISGTVGASNYAAITAPQLRGHEGPRGGGGSSTPSQLILLKLAKPGSLVKKGNPIAEFDNQWEEERLEDHKAQVIQAKAMVEKRRAEIAIENETEQQLLRSAKADHDKALLDLKTAEIRSAIDAEKMKLAVEEAAARYKQIQEEVRLKKLSQQANLRSLEIQVSQEQNHVERHNHNLVRMDIKAPIDGLVVMQPIYRSGQFGQVQEGDQVYPGSYFMQIVDLSKMVVNGYVNQSDSQGLALGQPATVRLEAYPDLEFLGRLTSMGAMATSGMSGRGRGARDLYVKMIPVRFSIGARDSRVIPDLSASADVKFKIEEKVPQIPREAVIEENGKTYATVRQGEGAQKREIRLGMHNNTHAVVLAGLSEGEEVIW